MTDDTTPRGDTTPGGAAAPVRPRSRLGAVLLGALVVVGIDQATKALALDRLEPGASTRWFLGELLGWKLVLNPGAALSVGAGSTWVLTVLALGVTVVIVLGARRITSRPWAVAFALVLGGAVGNLVDRLVRDPGFGHGHVVDFINYASFFVGNVADIAIVVAAALVMWLALRGVPFGDERADVVPTAEPAADETASTEPAADEPAATEPAATEPAAAETAVRVADAREDGAS